MSSKKLKLGILADSYELPAWEYNVLERIVKSNSAEFTLLVLNGGEGEHGNKKNRDSSLYFLFNQIDEKLFGKEPNPFTPKNISELLPNISEIKVYPVEANGLYTLNYVDILRIQEYQIDVLIKFGFRSLICESISMSKYGTWFYIYGSNQKTIVSPPGFLEVIENLPETSSALLAVGGELALNQVLYRSYFFTYPLSPARHRSYYFWAMASFLPRLIEYLHKFGESAFRKQIGKFNFSPYTEIQEFRIPSNLQALKAILKISNRMMAEFFKRIFAFDQWFLLYSFEKELSHEYAMFNVLMPPKDKFWADPHVIQTNDKYYIFVEEFCRPNSKGHISVIEMDEKGNYKKPVKILEKNYHLSYPFVLEWDGKYYMIPESGENRSIDVYECVEFPYQWKFKQTLMENVKAVDTTLLYHAGRWWLFTCIAENEAAAPNVELFLFYADDLFSKHWTAHSLNPIISDVKSARAAGRIFIKDGTLFRPSQDCSKEYGYGFDLNEIILLSETEYCEKIVTSVRPDWNKKIMATHTYANQGSLTVIDALTRRYKWNKTA